MQKESGYSMLELMIALAIVGILAAWAIPNYQMTVLKSHRKDMQGQMFEMAAIQEQLRTLNGAYAAQASQASDNGRYTVAVAISASLGYSISATATGDQVNDTGCTSLTLDGIGNRSPQSCWAK